MVETRPFFPSDGGIFDKERCKQGANHALLNVGRDREEDTDGQLSKYCIALHSWGHGWGESGYARIARLSHGSKGTPAVCGIARSASVALGGFLSEQEGGSLMRQDSMEKFQVAPMEKVCTLLALQLNGRCGLAADFLDMRHVRLLLSFWCSLSRDWRRRRCQNRCRFEERMYQSSRTIKIKRRYPRSLSSKRI